MIIPFSEESAKDFSELSDEFINLIKGLPEFPENITEVNRLINDPDSQMSDIAQKISNDVSLTAELLKLVNSASFGLASQCTSIGEAVKLAGLRGIRNLLFSIGSMQALTSDTDENIRALWDHSYRVAFYAYNLARNFCRAPNERNLVEDSYVCGLLHDMGKIIFETAHEDILQKITVMAKERGVSAGLFERMVAGVNHGEVGARIAEKWNFPQVIADVIRYHHDPVEAPEAVRKLVYVVNFSDLLAHYGEGVVDFGQFSQETLKMFGIQSEADIVALSTRLSKSFEHDKH